MMSTTTGADCGERRRSIERTHRRIFDCAAHYRESPLGVHARAAPRAPTLAALAEYIEATQPSLRAGSRASTVSTDRKYRGRRFRFPGKGRKGTLLTVYDRATGAEVFSHNSGERVKTNSEAVEWLVRHRFAEGVPATVSKRFGSDADSGRAATIETVENFETIAIRFDDGEPSLEVACARHGAGHTCLADGRLLSGHDLVTPLSADRCRSLARERPPMLDETEDER